jgi:hypothetical protein
VSAGNRYILRDLFPRFFVATRWFGRMKTQANYAKAPNHRHSPYQGLACVRRTAGRALAKVGGDGLGLSRSVHVWAAIR